ncbi:MAG: ribosome maturation factor RimP [Candidatus Omnitrophica bacterium]|nr:ribosome maturation factor RimP [Candidatus Omnitrophota bacterium]
MKELIEPLLGSRQVELVELTCQPQGGRFLLRFLVDTARGIRLDELSSLNQAIGALLDEHEVISDRYLLEVSSPGMDRPLRSQADFERLIGRRIRVTTAVPVNGRSDCRGELLGATEEAVFLRLDSGEKLQIQIAQIARAAQEISL